MTTDLVTCIPSRENVQRKGRRYLLEGRLQLLHVSAQGVHATCRGQGHLHRVSWLPDSGWSCSCLARNLCSHLVAAQLVVAVTEEGAW